LYSGIPHCSEPEWAELQLEICLEEIHKMEIALMMEKNRMRIRLK